MYSQKKFRLGKGVGESFDYYVTTKGVVTEGGGNFVAKGVAASPFSLGSRVNMKARSAGLIRGENQFPVW